MKLTKSQLKEVIEEELVNLLVKDELKSLDELLNEAEGRIQTSMNDMVKMFMSLTNHVVDHEEQLKNLGKRVEELTTQVNIPAVRAQQYVQRAAQPQPPEPTGTPTRQVVVRRPIGTSTRQAIVRETPKD